MGRFSGIWMKKSFKQSKIDGILTLNNLVHQAFAIVLQFCDNQCSLMHPVRMHKRCKGAPDMLEHLRSLPAILNSRSAGDSTSFTVLPSHDDHALWMQKMDITPFDFSYLSSLLAQAYNDWMNHKVSDNSGVVYSVWDLEGIVVEGQHTNSDINVRSMVLECAEKGHTLSISGNCTN